MINKLITLIIILALSNYIANAQVSEIKPWEIHGQLKATKHCLVHADGTPFFWMAATAWALAQNISREDVIWYLDKLKANKFNVVQVFTANDWALINMKNFYGDPPFDGLDATKLNKNYWDHLGWVIDQAAERGLYVFIVFGNPGRKDNKLPYVSTTSEAYQYGYNVGTIYKEKKNIIWCNGIDVNPTDTSKVSPMGFDGWAAMAEGITDGTTGKFGFDGKADDDAVLMTYHPNGPMISQYWFADAPWLDFNAAQLGLWQKDYIEGAIPGIFIKYYNAAPVKPFINIEPWYEQSVFKPYPYYDDWMIRVEAYQSIINGSWGFTHGHEKTCGLNSKKRENQWKSFIGNAGWLSMKYIYELFSRWLNDERIIDLPIIAWAEDNTQDSLNIFYRVDAIGNIDQGYAIVYSPRGKSFRLKQSIFGKVKLDVKWNDPRTGSSYPVTAYKQIDSFLFDPPGEPCEGNDWVLVIAKTNLQKTFNNGKKK